MNFSQMTLQCGCLMSAEVLGVRVSDGSQAWPGNLLRSGPLRPEPEEPEAGAGAERGQVTQSGRTLGQGRSWCTR